MTIQEAIATALDGGKSLTSRLQSFETQILAENANFAGLAGLSRH